MPGPARSFKEGQKIKTENPMKVLGRVMKYVSRDYLVHVILVVIFIVIGVWSTIQGTMFMQTLIDDYITPMLGQENPDFGPLLHAIIRVAIFYAIGVAAIYARSVIMVYVTQGTLRNLRDEMFAKMEKFPIRYFDTNTRGDIMSVYTNDIDTLRQMISQSIPQIINSLLTIVMSIVSMFILTVPLTLFAIGMLLVMVLATKRFAGRSGKYFVKQQRQLGQLDGYVEEMMAGQKVIKVFNHEEKAKEQFEKLNDMLFNAADEANKNANITMPVNANLGYISFVGSAIIGGAMALAGFGGVTLGGIASFLTLNKSISMPISMMSMELNAIVMALAGAERVFNLMDEEFEPDEGNVTLVNIKEGTEELIETSERTERWAWKKPETGELRELKGDVRFEHVDFGYVPEKTVLHDLSLYAKPGQKIAFVGSTGAGKTTITNLINRFYDIKAGTITYDGISINRISKGALRKSLGIVLQDAVLFSGTVMDNIRYGRPEATNEEVIAAAKLANADSFIRQLPDGYNTLIKGNGTSLSQGQRQLLTIARAAVADPPVIILDEATSSIDTRTERIVQEGMDKLMEGRTSFVIAHRLSTVKNSNAIMVLEQGVIIERGTHEQLLEQKGRYYQLYTGHTA
ncbi:MAG TPA: ABC transporter ATP-binding protein [Candidatus Alectryocaccobium stercorigallinarum]|nr:ABC transporter ATP-binding protein [Candidatus Alectryocaccobium stercorigallinarum]